MPRQSSSAARKRTNVFSAGALNRVSEARMDEQQVNQILQNPAVRFVPIWKNKNLVTVAQPLAAAFLSKAQAEPLLLPNTFVVLLGFLKEVPYVAFSLAGEAVPDAIFSEGLVFKDLREIGVLLPDDEASLLAYGRAMIHWHHTHQYCGKCGSVTVSAEAGHVRQCINSACGLKHFPRTDSAVIVRITHQDRCLLVRQPAWPVGMFATVAGFLEPGESLEDAVAREVREETGLSLSHIRYHSSQPWPFPASIMVGFTARATHTAFQLDGKEIEQAQWLTRTELEQKLRDGAIQLPPPLSIAYRLIQDWFTGKNQRVHSSM